MPARRNRSLSVAVALAALAGCARNEAPRALADAAPSPPRPVLAAGYAALVPPPRGADGQYRTINSGLDPQATIWHVRAALNVAAIGCRGADQAGIVPAYNAMLTSKKAVLARARRSVQASLQASAGKDWQAADDSAMTRLYNYFAMPAAKPAFCAAAAAIAPEAGAAPADGFDRLAATALPRLEAPFLAAYRTVDDHRVAVAQWEARYGAGTTRLAAAGSAPDTVADAATAAAAPRRAPRLAYRDIDDVIAFVPRRGQALAAR